MITRTLGRLKVPSGRLIVADPFTTSFDEPGSPLARTVPPGVFPVEVAIARFENRDQRVACARVRFADQPVEKWEVARFEGQEPAGDDDVPAYGVDAGMGCFFDEQARANVDESTTNEWLAVTEKNGVATWTWHVADLGLANVVMFSSGWGDGFYGSYWGLDGGGGVVALVTDFEVLLGPTTEHLELPLPLPRGRLAHPLLEKYDVTLATPLLSRRTVILGGKGSARVELTDGGAVQMEWKDGERHYTWQRAAPDARLVISVMTGVRPLDVLA